MLAVLLLAGCPAGGDDANVDGGPDATGLTVTWSVTPPTPGPIRTGLDVQELHISYSSVRLIGDAAPGDARTSAGRTELEWERSVPVPLDFPAAPPGLYAVLELGVGGGDEAFAIHGMVDRGGTPIPFEIEDEAPNPVTLGLAVELRAGASATVPVRVELAQVLAAVDFDALPVVNGHIELHRNDPQMARVRSALATATQLAGAD